MLLISDIHYSSLLCRVQTIKFFEEFSFGLTHTSLQWRPDLVEMQRACEWWTMALYCCRRWWGTGPMTSSFRSTKILAGKGGWRNQRYVLLSRCKHNLYLVRYRFTDYFGDYIKSIEITPNLSELQTKVKTGHNQHMYKHVFCFLSWTDLKQLEDFWVSHILC